MMTGRLVFITRNGEYGSTIEDCWFVPKGFNHTTQKIIFFPSDDQESSALAELINRRNESGIQIFKNRD